MPTAPMRDASEHNALLAITEAEKAEMLAGHWQKVCKTRSATTVQSRNKAREIRRRFRKELDRPLSEGAENAPFTLAEMTRALKSFASASSPGEDNLTYRIISLCSEATQLQILNLFNKCWDKGDGCHLEKSCHGWHPQKGQSHRCH